MSKEVKVLEENVLKLHAKGCDEIKEAMETLCPDLFEPDIEFDKDKIYAYCFRLTLRHRIRVMTKIDREFAWVNLDSTHSQGPMYSSGKKALANKAHDQYAVLQTFDNQEDFFKWALKQVK